MLLQQIFVACLSAFLILQHVAAVVNTGQTKKIEESIITNSESKDDNPIKNTDGDLLKESFEKVNRREASIKSHTYGLPSLPSESIGHFNLPVPVYGVPNAQSNNVIYPAPPLDIPPPPSKPSLSSLYGTPTFGKTYGVPQINPLPSISKGYGVPLVKYGSPSFFSNQLSTSLILPKPIYGQPKNSYGPPGKPLKYPKYPTKAFGTRPSKPAYGTPLNFKDNFRYNKLNTNSNNFNTNSLSGLYANSLSSNNAFSSLYSGISSINHQYGAPVLPPKHTISLQYGTPSAMLSTHYDVPSRPIVEPPVVAYGPPQPSPNPRPPHPGAPAPPTPPDIKYDGWQPIPGLVSKRPSDEVHHITAQGSGYYDLPPSPLNIGNEHLGDSYGAPPVILDISKENSLLDQPGLDNSYGVLQNSISDLKTGVSDSYSAPLGTVTGSGGIVASSGAEAHGGTASLSHLDSHSSAQSLTLDLSSIGLGHSSDIQAIKSVEYEINPYDTLDSNSDSSYKISNSYNTHQPSSISLEGTYGSKHSYNSIGSLDQSSKTSFSLHGHKSLSPFGSLKGLVPPSGVYGVPPSSRYGTPLYTNSIGKNYRPPKRPVVHREHIKHGVFQNTAKESYNNDIRSFGGSSSSLYLPPPPPQTGPSISYDVSGGTGAISFQNVVHGSSTAGIDLHQNTLNIEGASALPLTGYNVALGPTDERYNLSPSGSAIHVALDYSQSPQTNDLTQEKQALFSHDCVSNNQQYQVPSLAYGVPSADSYTSSLSGLTTNIATPQAHTLSNLVAPLPQNSELSLQYQAQDLAHSSSIKSEAKVNSIELGGETHGKNYGKSVAESFGPNSELVESQSIDLNNIPLQGNLGSYTLQIQSADGSGGQVPHTQVLNDGLLQSILQAIEQPGKQGQNNKYPIILQPSIERNNYLVNETLNNVGESQSQGSEIREVIVDAPKSDMAGDKLNSQENEEPLQLLDTSNIALYYKKNDDSKKSETDEKEDAHNVVKGSL